MTKQHDLFISYARADDEPFVKQLYQDLEKAGYKVWWDREAMESRGQKFLQVIRDAIASVDRVILVVGPKAISSDYVAVEWQYALEACTPLLPILRLGEYEEIPERLAKYHCPEFREKERLYKDAFAELLRLLNNPVQKGRLHDVPGLPAHFLPRPEAVEAINNTVLGDSEKPMVITGTKYATAVHGMGGVGKSVMAAAFARRCETRWAFDDGVLWLRFGQQANMLEILKVIGRFFSDDPDHYINETVAKSRLVDLFADKKSLFILDDIWGIKDTTPFLNALQGTRCRVLITTRNNGLARDLGAQEHLLDKLDDEQALALLADWAEQDIETLPDEALAIIEECDDLPLALAISGAMVKGKPAHYWGNVLHRLQNADLDKLEREFPNYPYRSVLAALQVSVNVLPAELRKRYLDFSVFPEDTPVPESVLQTFFARDGLSKIDTQDTIGKLADLSLLQQDKQGNISLHDLQYDYVRSQVGDLIALHKEFLEGYVNTLATEAWHTLAPDKPYIWRYLVYHFIEANEWNSLFSILTDFRFMEAKSRALSIYDLENDFYLALSQWKGEEKEKKILALYEERLRLESNHFHQAPELLFPNMYSHLKWLLRNGELDKQFRDANPNRGIWLRNHHDPLYKPELWKYSFEGHTKEVNSVAISPNGTHIISGSDDYSIKIWNLQSEQLVRSLEGHTGSVGAIVLHPDGNTIISASDDQTIKIWDFHTGNLLRSIDANMGALKGLAIAPNGKWFASGAGFGSSSLSYKKTIQIWDFKSGKPLRTLDGHKFETTSITILSDSSTLISGSTDKTIKVWNARNGNLLKSIESKGSIHALAVTSDDLRLVVGSSDKVELWSLSDGKLLHTFSGHPNTVLSVAITPDSNFIVSAGSLPVGSKNTVLIWDLNDTTKWRRSLKYTYTVSSVAITPDGKNIITGSKERTIRIWDFESGNLLRLLAGHTDRINAVKTLPKSKWIATCSTDRTIKLWNLEDQKMIASLEGHTSGVYSIAITPDEHFLVSGATRPLFGPEQTIRVWDLKSQKFVRFIGEHKESIQKIVITPDGTKIISIGERDTNIRIWDFKDGKLLKSFKAHTDPVTSLTITDGGQELISGSEDKTIKIWDLDSGNLLKVLSGHMSRITSIAVNSNKKQIVSGSYDGVVCFWDMQTGVLLDELAEHSSCVSTIEFMPDDEVVITGSWDTTIKIWDARNRKLLYVLEGHTEGVLGIATSYSQIISCSDDMTIKIWDFKKKSLCNLSGHFGGVQSVAVATDCTQIISGSEDKTAKVWDLQSGQLVRTFYDKEKVNAVAVIPGSKKIATASFEPGVKIWDLDNGQMSCFLKNGWEKTTSIAITSNGSKLISGSINGDISVWDIRDKKIFGISLIKNEKPLYTIEGHRDRINSIIVTPDSKKIVSASSDKTIRAWELNTGALLYKADNHTSMVYTVAVSPNGKWLASCSYDNTIKLWDLLNGKLVDTIEIHHGSITAITFTADNMFIISSVDKRILLWDIQARVSKVLFWNDSTISSLAISTDGHWLTAGDRQGRVWVFELMR